MKARRTVPQRKEKSASEIKCVRRAQESLVGFPMGRIAEGDDPPDCVIVDEAGTCCAVEVTEAIDRRSREIKTAVIKFFRDAERQYVQENPDRHGLRIRYGPGQAFNGALDLRRPDVRKRLYADFSTAVSTAVDEALKRPSSTIRPENDAVEIVGIYPTANSPLEFRRVPVAEGVTWRDTHYTNERGEDFTLDEERLQKLIKKKEKTYRDKCYRECPVILLVSAWLFPRGCGRSESFAVRRVHGSLVGKHLDTGWFREVFIHQADDQSYAISCKDGLVREVRNRTTDVPGYP